jgi:hypothetical protein
MKSTTRKRLIAARKYNALGGTAKFFSTSKDKLEEKFRDIEIRQDGPLGLVTCNYDFVINDKAGAITRHKLALFSGALLAVSCDHSSSR